MDVEYGAFFVLVSFTRFLFWGGVQASGERYELGVGEVLGPA